MSALNITAHNDYLCDEVIEEPPQYIHHHRCSNRGRWLVRWQGKTYQLCGTHVRWYRNNGAVVLGEAS